MNKRPQNAKFRFYRRLKVDKEIRKAIKFFHKWKKQILNKKDR